MSSLVWVELDGKAPEHNLTELRKNASPGVKFCAVIKSNAYGHGVAAMRGLLPSAEWFGVNSLEEGLELRGFGEKRPIILLGHVPLERLAEAVEADLSLTVYNTETLRAISSIKRPLPPAKLHLKIETGTGRQGIMPDELPGFIDAARSVRRATIEGVSTHFANIEDTLNHAYAEKQLEIFGKALKVIEDKAGRPPIIHTACTAATILFPKTHFTMLRAGIGLYGLWPSRETFLSAQSGMLPMPLLEPVLSWKTRIVQIKEVPEGSYIGYGCTYRTTRRTVLGVLPVGYSDGYDRALGNRAHILVKGKRAAVIGRICMNLSMADLTDIPGVRLEDEAVLLGGSGEERISAETMAEWAGTINYEIVTRINPLLPRTVVNSMA
jgi:alanine racemase